MKKGSTRTTRGGTAPPSNGCSSVVVVIPLFSAHQHNMIVNKVDKNYITVVVHYDV
jgi:hypothetical protein